MNRLEEILAHARGEDMYCIECFSADEANVCLDILAAHGWRTNDIDPDAIFKGVDEFEQKPVTCMTLWLYVNGEDVAYATTGYDDYQRWYRKEFGDEDEEPTAVMCYSELFNDAAPDAMDSDDFGAFLSSME